MINAENYFGFNTSNIVCSPIAPKVAAVATGGLAGALVMAKFGGNMGAVIGFTISFGPGIIAGGVIGAVIGLVAAIALRALFAHEELNGKERYSIDYDASNTDLGCMETMVRGYDVTKDASIGTTWSVQQFASATKMSENNVKGLFVDFALFGAYGDDGLFELDRQIDQLTLKKVKEWPKDKQARVERFRANANSL